MGAVRIFLAIAVVFDHMGIKAPGIDGYVPVLLFFAVSGFYMGLVLNEKYQSGVTAFYISRYLRLWPSYIAVFLAITIFLRGVPDPHNLLLSIHLWFVSVTMFLYETTWWLAYGVDGFKLVSSVRDSLSGTMNMPHVWSIGVELLFYLGAPFVARSPGRLILAVAAAYLIHVWLTLTLGVLDPFRYKSALNFAWIFLAGMGSYWVWKANGHRLRPLQNVPYAMLGVTFLFLAWAVVWVTRAELNARPSSLLSDFYVALFALAIGALFHATKSIRLDRTIGDLSYSVYLVHWPFAAIVFRDKNGQLEWAVLVAMISVAVAFLLYRLVEAPIDRYRQSLARRMISGTSPQHDQATA